MPVGSRRAESDERSRLGTRIRQRRTHRRLTLDELADLTGLSKTQLSRIETGGRRPSVDALMTIAKALGTNAGQLLAERVAKDYAARSQLIVRGDAKVVAEGGTDGGILRSLVIEMPVPGLTAETVNHDGELCVHVVSGEMRIRSGKKERVVAQGDTLHLSGRQTHRMSSASRQAVKALVVAAIPSLAPK